jgi:hypothetical protein
MRNQKHQSTSSISWPIRATSVHPERSLNAYLFVFSLDFFSLFLGWNGFSFRHSGTGKGTGLSYLFLFFFSLLLTVPAPDRMCLCFLMNHIRLSHPLYSHSRTSGSGSLSLLSAFCTVYQREFVPSSGGCIEGIGFAHLIWSITFCRRSRSHRLCVLWSVSHGLMLCRQDIHPFPIGYSIRSKVCALNFNLRHE